MTDPDSNPPADPVRPALREALAPQPHVLVVEDDGEMRHLIARLLRENGFTVTAARDGREMREVLRSAGVSIDLILLDVMLPGPSGVELLRELRSASSTPVVFLTARAEEMDRVIGLEFGADDYIVKPFGRRELIARLRAVLRRSTGTVDTPQPVLGAEALVFDHWVLAIGRRELTAPDGSLVDLSGAEFDLLMAFLTHPQRVLTREELLETARRRIGDMFDRSIDVLVSRLRRKIEPLEGSPPLIKTVRGSGYVFVAEVGRR
jgi:two-component system OmpR family response regulator